MDRPSLLDAIPSLLERAADISEALAAGQTPPAPEPEEASSHALERLEHGYDMGEMLVEYALLRKSIVRRCLVEAPELGPGELMVVHEVIDEAAAASASRFVRLREQTLKALDRISPAALGNPEVDELLQRLVEVLHSAHPAVDSVSLLLVEGDRLYVRATSGLEEERCRGFSVAMGEGFSGRVAAERRPILLREAATDPLVRSEVLRARGTRALYGVPLEHGGMRLGVAHMGSRTASEFSGEELLLFRAMAERAADAIAHAVYVTSEQVGRAVASVLASATSLEEAIPKLLAEVGATCGWRMGAAWMLEAKARVLRLRSLWKAASFRAPSFEEMSRRGEFRPGEGLPGRTLLSGEATWISDIALDPSFPRRAVALQEGLRSAVAFPLRSGERILGVLEFLSDRLRAPAEALMRMTTLLGEQLSGFAQRLEAQEQLRTSEAQNAAILESALDCIISSDAQDRVVGWNPAAERTFGYAREEVLGRDMADLIIPPHLREAHRRGFARYLATGEERYFNRRLEMSALRKDGTEFPVELIITRISVPGPPVFTGHIRDITERRRAEQALRESQALLQAIIDNSPSVIFVKDREGKYQFINREYERLFNLNRREVAGKTDEELHSGAVARAVREADRLVLETCAPHTFEETLPTVKGERVFVTVKFPLLDANGSAYALCGIATDLTESKRAEEALRSSETRYRLATEAISDAIWEWNLETDGLEWSAGVQKLFGYPLAEIRPDVTWWYEHIHPDDRDRVVHGIHAVIDDTGDGWEEEYRFRHRSGSYVVVTDHGAIERDARGKGVRMVGAMQDVSALRAAQLELARNEARFRSLANSIPQLAWMADGTGNIFWYNQRWYDYTGTTLEEVRGWGWQKVQHPEHVQRVVERIRHAFETGEVWEDTFPLRSREGEYRRFLSRALPIRDEQGRVVRWFGTNTDIEERLRVEEELQRRIAFEEQLIGIVSHDLRNPINATLMGCQLLLRRGGLDERQTQGVKRVQGAAERASRLVRDLLDFTRERMGKAMPLERHPVDLHALTHLVLEEVRMANPGRMLEETHQGDGRGQWGPDRLAQVLTNLTSNALAYSPPDSAVRVVTRGEEDSVLLQVHNTGAPIPPEVLPRLFQPFERGIAGDSGSRSIGLGLFIVDRIVRAYGGSVEVRSTAEEGTTFSVRLPRSPT